MRVVLRTLVFGVLSDGVVKLLIGVITLAFIARGPWIERGSRVVAPARPNRIKSGFWAGSISIR